MIPRVTQKQMARHNITLLDCERNEPRTGATENRPARPPLSRRFSFSVWRLQSLPQGWQRGLDIRILDRTVMAGAPADWGASVPRTCHGFDSKFCREAGRAWLRH